MAREQAWRTGARAGAAAAGAVVAALALAPATAAGASYAALGDSYSSGTGTRAYLTDGTSCSRSVYSFPSLLASGRGYALDLRACAGATTADVAALQLGALSGATAHVTLTVGGNDAGFVDVLTECARPAWMSDCTAAVDRAQGVITSSLPGRLASLYAAVRSRAPQARVVVAGYPRVFNGTDCNSATWFSAAEMSRLNATADLLNATAAAAARTAGVSYANPTASFTGHAVCDPSAWVNGLSSPTADSYHPNRSGHASGYAPLVGTALTGSAVPVSAATLALAEASAEDLAARQRPHAAQDRTIEPAVVRAPDLTSPEARAAAARAGVDLRSRASIDAADRRYEEQQATARGAAGGT
ncbi:SGNH/GDSL hydrolase family protein [Quadrisphaera sp. DSM 44207]|uniref:SGNH/GDSL hydrolase family protein n=1 Tax=Quadrisphaera sp. DSM 44207 TaxID=1881057 RepID=UPI00088C6F99|nr:SGNH/GDSL hydrolase family protein [Quadrisphaera sp. DSM 44207]SDQ07598.1 GDSL-like Lipase/Acylhydrolase family protein [Quadrisphaera sp. DSM 44207]